MLAQVCAVIANTAPSKSRRTWSAADFMPKLDEPRQQTPEQMKAILMQAAQAAKGSGRNARQCRQPFRNSRP
jgi:hypothetical protein